MDRTKKEHLRYHVHQLRQQFAQSGTSALSQAFDNQEMQQILSEEIGRYRARVYPPLVILRRRNRRRNRGQIPII